MTSAYKGARAMFVNQLFHYISYLHIYQSTNLAMDQTYMTSEQILLYKTACYIKAKLTRAKDQTEVLEQRISQIQVRLDREDARTVRYALLELELLQLEGLKNTYA